MKILFFADLHSRKLYRNLSAKGIIEDVLRTIDEIYEVAEKFNVECIYSLGDLFHKVGMVSVELVARIYGAFSTIAKDFPIHFLLGNHDLSGEYTILEPFRHFGSIIRVPEMRKHDGISFFCYPFTTGTYMFEKADFLLGHLSIAEGKLDSTDIKLKEQISVEELKDYYKSGGFLGHYHSQQRLEHDFYYIGSALQLSFGERGQAKFCMIFDTSTHKLEWVKLVRARRYDIINVEEGTIIAPEIVENHIIKFVIPGNMDPEAVLEMVGKDSECIIERTSLESTVKYRLDPKASLIDTISKYVTLVDTELARNKLIKLGRRIVSQYEEERVNADFQSFED